MIDVPVSSVMIETAPIVSPDTPTTEAAARLRAPDVPALVVSDGAESIAGIVTESDIVAVVAEGGRDHSVESFMSHPVTTTPPSTPVGLAADRMRDTGISLLPVVDEDGSYRGLVTREAIAPYLPRYRLEVDWDSDPLRLDASDVEN